MSFNTNSLRCLERQGRSALVPDSVISNILGRLQSNVTYEPLLSQKVFGPEEDLDMKKCGSTIVDNMVTGTCPAFGGQKKMKCEMVATAINSIHLPTSGTLMI
ncbi:hypothetical protein KIN20_021471 [Parelaphostrongylus tenuis]|uniref:Uncharacterized protein n=1 Tax=Parelaphostrongylus tenuis TaxID=148309 RepID=A0AAD5N4I1_PARTN|nr:hypothetical protein KIN20_021471 [Parelaphostrongylus tenuis]